MSESWDAYKRRKETEFGIVVIPRPRYETPKPPRPVEQERKPKSKRYNVHKRSLPVGVPPLDRIVFFNVSKREAEMLVEKFLKTKCYEDDARGTKTVIYYDMIPVDAQPRERSIYFNEGPLTREEGSDPESPEIIHDAGWIG